MTIKLKECHSYSVGPVLLNEAEIESARSYNPSASYGSNPEGRAEITMNSGRKLIVTQTLLEIEEMLIEARRPNVVPL